jgi:hypothetical protein
MITMTTTTQTQDTIPTTTDPRFTVRGVCYCQRRDCQYCGAQEYVGLRVPESECGYQWSPTLIARLVKGHKHQCAREFGHNTEPATALHRCRCGQPHMVQADIAAGVRGLRAAAAACLAVAALTFGAAATAHADQPDPHIPNMAAGYCPGGGMGANYWLAYCDGLPYPDGSYWHGLQYGTPVIGRPYGLLSPGLQCVINTGGPVPEPAPPGGCGGAVQ